MNRKNKHTLYYLVAGAVALGAILSYKGTTSRPFKRVVDSGPEKLSLKVVSREQTEKTSESELLDLKMIREDDICRFVRIEEKSGYWKRAQKMFFSETSDLDLESPESRELWKFAKEYFVEFRKSGKLSSAIPSFTESVEALTAGAVAGVVYPRPSNIKVDIDKGINEFFHLMEKYPNNGMYPLILSKLFKKKKRSKSEIRLMQLQTLESPDFYTPAYKISRELERHFVPSITRQYLLNTLSSPTIFYIHLSSIVDAIRGETEEFANKALVFARMLQKKMDYQNKLYIHESIALYGVANRMIEAVNLRLGTDHTSKYGYKDVSRMPIPDLFQEDMNEIVYQIDEAQKSGDTTQLKEYQKKQLKLYDEIFEYKRNNPDESNREQGGDNPYALLMQKDCDRTGVDLEFEEYKNGLDMPFNFQRYIKRYL